MSVRNTTSSSSSSGTSTPVRPHPLAPYYPPADTATYRDLLLFEERLKSNAEMLRKRRQRYKIFLYTFIFTLGFLAWKLFISPPKSNLRIRAIQASMAVVSVTLVLFFASGMYEEKIKYAYSYITHSNKALRPLNMHLNMRRPKTSFLSYIPYLRHTVSTSIPSPPTSSPSPTPPTNHLSPPQQQINKPFLGGLSSNNRSNPTVNTKQRQQAEQRKVSNSTNVMATIPPSSNPRGELIFSSRVDRNFREGYERYRAAFERRREEKSKEESKLNLNSTNWFLWTTSSTSSSNLKKSKNRRSQSPSPNPLSSSNGRNTPQSQSQSRSQTPPPGSTLNTTSNTPRGIRRSPSPGESGLRNSIRPSISGGIDQKKDDEDSGRERSESYSFLLNQNQTQNHHLQGRESK